MLAAARERGIVQIRINDPAGRDLDLEGRLAARFGLRGCLVAENPAGERSLPRVGELGARWLLENLHSGQRVGVSWGQTVQAVVRHVPEESALDVEVLPLVGGLSAVDSAITGEELVRDLADRLGGRFQRLHAPALLTSKAGRDILLAEPSIGDTLERARRVHVAVVGIGSFGLGSSAALVKAMELSPDEFSRFQLGGPVGDCCARFFDRAGKAVPGPVDDRVLSVSLGDLAGIPTVAGVASGTEKAPGTLGALRSGVLDVLICDQSLAEALLDLDNNSD
ncbi:DNA-binding protein [Amycolatopsis taiwanensis]|uniref:DNA-binding protein n=2 Tax=Amycolatopsis taiwanensis TaxID=342230 RepID=A0A9W6RAP6_9PSEU|nr:DNA-binding protein [Amycolatopsis taiwanensis]